MNDIDFVIVISTGDNATFIRVVTVGGKGPLFIVRARGFIFVINYPTRFIVQIDSGDCFPRSFTSQEDFWYFQTQILESKA